MGECFVMSYIIRTFDLSMIKFETGQGNKFFSKRVDSDLPCSLVWGKYIRQVGVYLLLIFQSSRLRCNPQTNTQR